MKTGIIGRTEVLYDTALLMKKSGHTISYIITAKEAPEYTRTAEDFRTLADEWSVPFASGADIEKHHTFIKKYGADIGVSMNYSGIIPRAIIDLFPLGILNAHGGDLPRYRGNACQAWAILNGESRIGLCIHKMIGGELDSGDIIARDYLPIDHTTKVTRTWEWMAERTPGLMMEAVNRLNVNPDYVLERQSKNPADALRCYPRRPEDGRIDWNKPAIDVMRLINASNKPYAGAFCEYEGKKMIIWDAALVSDSEVFCAVPGQVTARFPGFIYIACRNGKLRLNSVEYENKISEPDNIICSLRCRLY